MNATITAHDSAGTKGFLIACRDAAGHVIERHVVSEVFIEGNPWPEFEAKPGNLMRLLR